MTPSFEVVEATQARTLPAQGDKPELAVDHMTLRSNGQQILVTAFRRTTTPLPTAGQTLEGELGENDRFEKDRRKFKKTPKGGGGAAKDGYWERKEQREIANEPMIRRQSARRDALTYIAHKIALGKIEDFDISDVEKITDALERLLAPPSPPSDVPGDTTGLPSGRDL